MTAPSPFDVARWIEETIQAQTLIPLFDATNGALAIRIPDWSNEKRSEVAEDLQEDLVTSLQELIEIRHDDGIEPGFLLEGEPGAYYIRARIEKEEDKKILSSLRSISPTSFEEFCTQILEGLGGRAIRVGGTHDGGVDFIAEGIPLSKFQSVALKRGSVSVIGQAKRYQDTNLISLKDMRDFIGSAILRSDTIKRDKSDQYGIFSPIIFAFWTTSDFNRNAREYSSKLGVWLLPGLALAQLSIRLKIVAQDWFPDNKRI